MRRSSQGPLVDKILNLYDNKPVQGRPGGGFGAGRFGQFSTFSASRPPASTTATASCCSTRPRSTPSLFPCTGTSSDRRFSPRIRGFLGFLTWLDRLRWPAVHQGGLRPPFRSTARALAGRHEMFGHLAHRWPTSFCQSTVHRQRRDVRPVQSTVAPSRRCCRSLPPPGARVEPQTRLRFALGASRPRDSAYHGLRERVSSNGGR